MKQNKTYDCIVIGSGPGGAPFALRLAKSGMNVLILEAGPRYDPYKDYSLNKDNWEISGFPHKDRMDITYGEKQTLNPTYGHLKSWNKGSGGLNLSKFRHYFEYSHVVGLGGTTLHFQGEAHRLNPSAFRMRSLFDVGVDWPIDYNDLAPYYSEIEKIIGVSGPDVVPNRPMEKPYPLPAHELSFASQIIQNTCKKLGFKLTPNSVAILSRPYRDTPPCNYCNGCVWGCPRKDKGSVDVTFIPLLENTGHCEIITQAFASRVEVEKKDGKSIAKGVHYFDKEGKEHFVNGDYIAVACGAVETPRLLLNSGINQNGLVGKNFMETVFYQAQALHPNRLDSFRGIPIDSVIWDWNEPSPKQGLIGGLRLYPTVGSAMGPVDYALRYFGSWGENFVKDVEKWFGHAIAIAGIGEFFPNDDTFVTVDENVKDKYGMPVAKIQSFLGESELKILNFMSKTSKDILKETGADEIVEEFSTYDFFSATHVFGTARMGDDPEKSVVGADLRCHEIKNLLITDASVFPTTGGGDAPSLTIEALSLRAADLLLEKLKKG